MYKYKIGQVVYFPYKTEREKIVNKECPDCKKWGFDELCKRCRGTGIVRKYLYDGEYWDVKTIKIDERDKDLYGVYYITHRYMSYRATPIKQRYNEKRLFITKGQAEDFIERKRVDKNFPPNNYDTKITDEYIQEDDDDDDEDYWY